MPEPDSASPASGGALREGTREPGSEPSRTREPSGSLDPLGRLWELRRSAPLTNGDVAAALVELTALAAEVLGVASVRIWHLSADGRRLECIHFYHLLSRNHGRGGTLDVTQHARYVDALRLDGRIGVADVRRDPRARELSDSEVEARLDVAVRLRGQFVGVVSCEHAGGPRMFRLWEELFVGSLSDYVAMVLQVREQLRAEAFLADQRVQVDDLLESRTSAVVRENADLQREVDALQLAAETIRKSEDERRRLFAASPVPMLLVRKRDQVVLLANDRCAAALRCKLSDFDKRRVNELFVHQSDFGDTLSTLERGGEVDALEIQLCAADGSAFWALLSARTVQFGEEDSALIAFTDLTAQKAVEHQLRTLAQRDPLTQAYNRHHFWQIAHNELSRVKRYQRPLSLAMVDADLFKAINDQHGHDAGDMVLRAIVDTCHETLRESDVLARYGGEEFVVLLPETPSEGAQTVMERLRERVESTSIMLDDGREVRVTVSIGLSALLESDPDVETVLKRADEALYAAKHSGRNRVVLR
ncbi:MAG: diguanylate cyclase [Myxococcales bacterium]